MTEIIPPPIQVQDDEQWLDDILQFCASHFGTADRVETYKPQAKQAILTELKKRVAAAKDRGFMSAAIYYGKEDNANKLLYSLNRLAPSAPLKPGSKEDSTP